MNFLIEVSYFLCIRIFNLGDALLKPFPFDGLEPVFQKFLEIYYKKYYTNYDNIMNNLKI
jgi:hypothetical protein